MKYNREPLNTQGILSFGVPLMNVYIIATTLTKMLDQINKTGMSFEGCLTCG